MAGLLSATVGSASYLAARIAYASIEGVAFLLTRPAAAIIAGAEMLVLLKTAGPREVISTAVKAAIASAVARSVWAFLAASQTTPKGKSTTPPLSGKNTASASTTSLAGDAPDQADAAVATMAVAAAANATGSIWDWEPPESDAGYSGAWHVLRELVLTTNTLKAENPEIYNIMERPEATPAEMLVRLHYLAVIEEKQGVEEAYELNNTENKVRPADEDDLNLLRHMRPLASMAYDLTDDATLAAALAPRGYRLLAARYEPDLASTCPAYFLAISEGENDAKSAGTSRWASREVVLCVRGTYSPEDVFTDLLAAGSTFSTDPDGTVHSVHAGMARGARFLYDKFGGLLASLRDAGVGVTLMGHSLGAGVSSLLSLHLLHNAGFDASTLRCLAYEPPACMDLPLARSCAGVVTSLVTADDIVPRMAVQPFYNLLKELVAFDWKAAADKFDGGQLPAALVVTQKMASMFGAPSKTAATRAAQGGESESGNGSGGEALPEEHRPEAAHLDSPGDLVTAAAKYNPFVPGKVIFVALPPGESGAEPDPASAVRVVLEPTHPALRRIRVTARFVLDHFIDHAYNIAALGEVSTAAEAERVGKAD